MSSDAELEVLGWRDGHIVALDQTALPHEICMLHLTTVAELVDAIGRLAIRGAPVGLVTLRTMLILSATFAVRARCSEIWAGVTAAPTRTATTNGVVSRSSGSRAAATIVVFVPASQTVVTHECRWNGGRS